MNYNDQPDNLNSAHNDHQPDSRDDLSAYALEALDTEDYDDVSEAIAGSAELQEELRRDQEIVGLLGHAAQIQQPPANLRDRVLASADAVRRPVPISSRRRLTTVQRLGGIAAALLIVALAGLSAFFYSQVTDRDDQIDALQNTVAMQDQRLAMLEDTARQAGANINFDEPLIWTQLSVTGDDLTSTGYLARTADGQTGYLVITDIPTPSDEVLQAWLINGDQPSSAGTFVSDSDGRAFLILQHAENQIDLFSQIGVTFEPPGGSQQPTSTPVLAANIV